MEINNKILEQALKVLTSPSTYGPETPMLQSLELFERVRTIYTMGFEDGRKQKEADEIILNATHGRD